ncbi:hypothetical protein HN51_005022 [Arachis hypogaea]
MLVNRHHLPAPSSAPPHRGRTPDRSSSLACRLTSSLIPHPTQSRRARPYQPPPRSKAVKAVMLKACVEAKEASLKKRRFSDDEDYHEQTEKEKDNSQQKGKDIRNFITKGKGAQVQSTINQMMKKDLKEQCDQQCAIFLYTSAIPFNVIKNPEFLKFCEIVGRYGIGYKPPSYHELRET